MTQKKYNHLQNQHSLYLLQHALNPVDWYPWNLESLEHARITGKLMVISIGYSACHWCHVMEHESFEDHEVAEIMNQYFVSIKVDREEHPDVDQVYMTAAYVASGRGGWPLNVITLPDQRPVFAGTYFPRHDWLYILKYFADIYQSNPQQLIQQAGEIQSGMLSHFRVPGLPGNAGKSLPVSVETFNRMLRDFDYSRGGSLGAPKFPMPATLRFMMDHGLLQHNPEALNALEITLLNMARGGIYDHLGGGFCRYSVDADWHVPHFEKMLYDNAQLISLYSAAFKHLGNPVYRKTAIESIEFANRELIGNNKLYHASLDADSEGSEGRFYTWTSVELTDIFHDTFHSFMRYFDCTEAGNWESGLNVLKISDISDEIIDASGFSADAFESMINQCRTQLFSTRSGRPAPACDTKILTGWNALMISALTIAYDSFGDPAHYQQAYEMASFYYNAFISDPGRVWRNLTTDGFVIPGYLEDYSLLEKAYLDIYQTDLNERWLHAADILNEKVLLNFSDPGGVFFRVSSSEEPSLIQQPVELSDNVIPASNSVMAENLLVLGYITGRTDYLERAGQMIAIMAPQVSANPWFHANWAAIISLMESGPVQVSIVGDGYREEFEMLKKEPLHGIIWSGGDTTIQIPALQKKWTTGKTLIYVCSGQTCAAPVSNAREATGLISRMQGKGDD
jgi:uncharacterized protein YyaL (SSP411 family)